MPLRFRFDLVRETRNKYMVQNVFCLWNSRALTWKRTRICHFHNLISDFFLLTANLVSNKTSSMTSFHTKAPKRSFCPLVPLCFSPLLLTPSALVGILLSATESLKVSSSIMLTKELVSCSDVTTGGRCFSATETRCTASLLRCSSSRFLAWRIKEVVWQRR